MKTTLNKQIEIVVNLGNYQSMRITSGIVTEPEGNLDGVAVAANQDALTASVAADLRRSLTGALQILGKKSDAPDNFAAACAAKLSGSTQVTQSTPS